MKPDVASAASLTGAIAAAVAASACCVGPLVFALLGLSGAGFLLALEPYRSVFTVLTFGFLSAGFYLTYRRPAETSDDCGCELPRTNRLGKTTLWVATGVAGLALSSPHLIPYLL